MSKLFSVTAPLCVRKPDSGLQLVAELLPLDAEPSPGLVFFDPWWHLASPDEAIHVLRGPVKGDGPWKCANHIFNIVGCQGTDPHLAQQNAQWRNYLEQAGEDYPPAPLIAAIARRISDAEDAS